MQFVLGGLEKIIDVNRPRFVVPEPNLDSVSCCIRLLIGDDARERYVVVVIHQDDDIVDFKIIEVNHMLVCFVGLTFCLFLRMYSI